MSARRRQDRDLARRRCVRSSSGSGGTYGSPRIHRGAGRAWPSRQSSARRTADARGRPAGPGRARLSAARRARIAGSVGSRITCDARTRPGRIRSGSATSRISRVGGRWWYLVVVLDQCSRRVLAWRLAATRDSRVTRAVLDAALRRRRPRRRPDLSQRSRQRVSGDAGAHALGGERRAAEHDARRRAGRERAHGVVLPLAQGRRDPRAVVSDRRLSSASSSVGTCGTTTTSACIRRWVISRPLTMNVEPRRTSRVYRTEGRSRRRCDREPPRLKRRR